VRVHAARGIVSAKEVGGKSVILLGETMNGAVR
jgi:hypothetical protein